MCRELMTRFKIFRALKESTLGRSLTLVEIQPSKLMSPLKMEFSVHPSLLVPRPVLTRPVSFVTVAAATLAKEF